MGRKTVTILRTLALTCALALCVCGLAGADTIASWSFDSQSELPDVGSGSITLIGGVNNANAGQWATGNPSSGKAWNTDEYPSQGAGNRTGGIEFSVPTTGYENIQVSFDKRHSGTASSYVRFQFSTNGGSTWSDAASGSLTSVSDKSFHSYSFDLSSFSAVENNASFKFRMVTEFAPSSSQYVPSDSASYSSYGTIRWDNIVVSGNTGSGGDTTSPSVTINQGSSQSDPTSILPVVFDVSFSETVYNFATGDVQVSGTAGGTMTATVSGSGANYTVTVDGATSYGTIIATIPAGVCNDAAGNLNNASTSTDNVITYDEPAPTPAKAFRLACWNVSNYGGSDWRDNAFKTAIYSSYMGRSMSPDIIFCQEVTSQQGADDFCSLLNSASGSPGDWAAAPFVNGNDTDNALFYRTSRFNFINNTVVHAGGYPPEIPRDVMRYDLSAKGYATGEAPVVAIYSSHMKAGSGSDDQARRLLEAQYIRNDAESLNPDWYFIYGGDMNVQSSSQSAYQEMVGSQANNAGRFFDPIATPGSWNNNSYYRFVHTQDPAGSGGMDDRHDQILLESELVDGVGFDYAGNPSTPYSTSTWNDPNHSYRAWGNDGTSYNSTLTVSGNQMVGATIAQALVDVASGGGHLPVFCDFQLPAQVDRAPASINFGNIVKNSSATETFTVGNGVDESLWTTGGIAALGYTLSATGDFSVPGGTFSDDAGGVSNSHIVTLDTSTAGTKTGTITITPTDSKLASKTIALSANVIENDLTVTIDQAYIQPDPTTGMPVVFTATFSSSVSDFDETDVTIGGTAASGAYATVTGSGTNYTISIQGVTTAGTITASIPAGAAHNSYGTPNEASTSTDNTVYVLHPEIIAMTTRAVGNTYGLSTVGLHVKTTGVVSNLSGTTCDIDDGTGVVHVDFTQATISGAAAPVDNGDYITVSGLVTSGSPKTIYCMGGDEVIVY